MNHGSYWHEGDDAAVARYLAEHGSVGQFEGDEFVVSTGREDMLPPWPPDATQIDPERYIDGPDVTPAEWPPTVNLPGLAVPLAAEPVLERATCARCGTALARREGEWRHEVSFAERGGCREARAEG